MTGPGSSPSTDSRQDDAEQYVSDAQGHEGHVVTVKRRGGYAYWKCSCGDAWVGWLRGAM